MKDHIDALVLDCRNSSLLATEFLQSYTKPSILTLWDGDILWVSAMKSFEFFCW